MEPHSTSIPPILYGTAWKENDTERLVMTTLFDVNFTSV